jgi:hypothetical protein
LLPTNVANSEILDKIYILLYNINHLTNKEIVVGDPREIIEYLCGCLIAILQDGPKTLAHIRNILKSDHPEYWDAIDPVASERKLIVALKESLLVGVVVADQEEFNEMTVFTLSFSIK